MPRRARRVGMGSGRAEARGKMRPPARPGAELLYRADLDAPKVIPLLRGAVAAFSRPREGRAVNQDTALVLPLATEVAVLAVADGMGGARGGARAAQVALEALQQALIAGPRGASYRDRVLEGFEQGNARVRALRVGAGATLVVALLEGDSVRLFHAGDSQALVVGQRGIVKAFSNSHSPVGLAVAAGVLDHDEALHHPALHVVSNGLGNPELYVEVASRLPLSARDTVLLASDGLFDNLYPYEVVEAARRGAPEKAAASLVEQASQRMAAPEQGAPSKPDDLTFLLYRPRRRAE